MSNVVPYPIYIRGDDLGFQTRQARIGRAKQIIEEIAACHGITVAALTGESRRRHLIDARWKAVRRVYDETGLGTPSIGKLFGDRDHTTILYALRKTEPRG